MFRWPWISREHHAEVVRLLNEQISFLRYQMRQSLGSESPMEEMPALGEPSLLHDPERLAALIEQQTRRRDGTDDEEDDGLPPVEIRRSARRMSNWQTKRQAETFRTENLPIELAAQFKKAEEEAQMMLKLSRERREGATN